MVKKPAAENEPTTAEPTAQVPEIKMVPIAKIDLHTQVRARVDRAVVQSYAELIKEGAEFPPVDVFRDGERTRFDLADGYHRLRAYEKLRRATIPARVHAGTRDDAWWFALGANRTHGLRLRAGDVRRAVQMALKQRPDASQRVIAAHVGCSHRYVGMVRKELEELEVRLAEETETAGRHSQVGTTTHLAERTVGADGKSYRARRPATPKPPPPGKATDTPASSASQPAAPLDSGPVTPVAATEPSVPFAVIPDPDPGSPAPPSVGPALPLLSPPPSPESGEVSPPPPETTPVATSASEPAGDAAPLVQAAAPRRMRVDSNRIVAAVTHDAAHLGDQDELIAFDTLDRDQTAPWVEDALEGIRYLETLVERLRALPPSK